MQKTKIDWPWKPLYTWNPVSGCFHLCRRKYCYNTTKPSSVMNRFGIKYRNNNSGDFVRTKNWKERETIENHIALPGEVFPYGFDPTFYPHRLIEPVNTCRLLNIFVVDTGDLFGHWVCRTWIKEIILITITCPQHTFFFLTKNPRRYHEFNFPENCWLGATVTGKQTGEDWPNNLKNDAASHLHNLPNKTFLSIEPLLGGFWGHRFDYVDQIIVGAMTGPGAVKPKREWIESIKHPNIYYKNNIREAMNG